MLLEPQPMGHESKFKREFREDKPGFPLILNMEMNTYNISPAFEMHSWEDGNLPAGLVDNISPAVEMRSWDSP